MGLSIKKTIKNIFSLFSRKIYLFLALFLFVDLIFIAVIVFQYYISPKEGKPSLFISIQINQPLLNKFYSDYRARERKFIEIGGANYPNLIKGPEKLTGQ